MTPKSGLPQRRSIRLPEYDYAQSGSYFVTVCVDEKVPCFGYVVENECKLSGLGKIAELCWRKIPELYSHLTLDVFVIMPNHLHGILMVADEPGQKNAADRATHCVAPTNPNRPLLQSKSLGVVIGQFKAAVTREAKRKGLYQKAPFWQRGYYDHIIRNELDLQRIQEYILYNPARWSEDVLYLP